MTTYYRIVDWDRHYEVDAHGHAWRPGKGFRHAPIDYVRNKARGRSWSRSALALCDMTDGKTYLAAMGAFQKLTEIVACSPRAHREDGIIRNRKGEPATIEEIAWMLRIELTTVEEVLPLLAHPEVAWIEEVPKASALPGQEPQEAVKGSGNSGDSGISGNFGSHVAQESGTHVAYTDKSSRSRSKVKRSQVNGPGESPDTGEIISPLDGPPADPGLGQPHDSHDLFLKAGFDSTRLGFLRELRVILQPQSNSDHQAIINFEQWLHRRIIDSRAGPGDRDRQLTGVIRLAHDCCNGDCPMAVFLSRVKAEHGYVPPSRQRERMRLFR